MQALSVLLTAMLMGAVSSVQAEGGWTTGRNATGTTDPNVTSNCTYWANDISSSATCEQVQEHFDIDFNHLHAWVSLVVDLARLASSFVDGLCVILVSVTELSVAY
ncbi:predicted protein [Aspergillus terreus NIH2624]|uniref:Uncharacterized protein n=1 Tax=Aspergillus terreus (strain NIH 2624 / FGSC A1156) TaxID=341663 RepID=Q0CCJ6_ASPTN|nr:uncharacterized protein ATEG_08588 [Aspergillus terreus NIH2624]EAU30720.1 predicted protein [Aspergillus terreus NIH2624]